MSENTSDPGRIERDLGETRARLDSRLSELQERLSPGQILDDLVQYFRGSEGADFGRSLLDNVKSNPLPAAVTGIGLAWLMASNQRPQPRDAGASTSTSIGRGSVRVSGPPGGAVPTTHDVLSARVRHAEQGVVRQQGEAEHAYNERLDAARGQAIGIARQAQETAGSFSKRIQEALAAAAAAVGQGSSSAAQTVSGGILGLRDRAGDAARSISSTAQHTGRYVGDQWTRDSQTVRRASGNLASALAESPVLLGALGLAAGALLGALVPQSDEEEAALAGVAGQARNTARDLAQDAVGRGSHVAQAVLDAGHRSVSEHGLTSGKSVGDLVDAALSGELAGNAKQVAQDVLRAGDEAARKEGLGEDQGSPKPSSAA